MFSPTPGTLVPLFPRDLTYLSFRRYYIRTATDDDKSIWIGELDFVGKH